MRGRRAAHRRVQPLTSQARAQSRPYSTGSVDAAEKQEPRGEEVSDRQCVRSKACCTHGRTKVPLNGFFEDQCAMQINAASNTLGPMGLPHLHGSNADNCKSP